jgi:hypothetical protein
MTRPHTSIVLGFHGCDRGIGTQAISGELELIPSDQGHDWLGPGIYFWEGDPVRAREWAETKARHTPGMDPFVIGAAIDRGHCLDLTSREDIELVRGIHANLVASLSQDGRPIPQNRNARGDPSRDELLRNLDCAVIRYLHDEIELEFSSPGGNTTLKPFDSVRALFREGDPIYPSSGFYERTHTQIAVRSLECIKGVFLPRH